MTEQEKRAENHFDDSDMRFLFGLDSLEGDMQESDILELDAGETEEDFQD